MRVCCVKTCENTSKSESVIFFSFPKTELRNEWIKFTQKEGWKPSKNSKICSAHFLPNLINGRKQLQEGAVPTLPVMGLPRLLNKV